MVPRKAGQYAFEQFKKLAIVGVAAIMGSALLIRFAPAPYNELAIVAGIIVVGAGRAVLEDAEHWLDGGIGERKVGRVLDAMGSEGFVSIHDLQRRVADRRWNIDHIVLGPTGAFAIETKAWKRGAYASSNGLMRGAFNASAVLGHITSDSMEVRTRLKNVHVSGWVESVLVLTEAPPRGRRSVKNVTVIHISELPQLLRTRRNSTLTPEQVVRGRASILRGDATVVVTPISYESKPRNERRSSSPQ
jgi:Nuclease-related domain